jgi:glycosyltransferase involved in cell wall biosynthesis
MIFYSPEMENFNKDVKTGVVGYGTMFFAFQKALKELGHELRMTTGDNYLHFIPPEHALGASHKWPTKNKRYFFTMWEADGMPQKWIDGLNECSDAIFVPNEFNKKLFRKCGYTKPIHVIPLGINPLWFKREKREVKDEFRFFHFNAGEPRKNWYMLLDAFLEEFENEDNVKMVVKNSSVHARQFEKSITTLSPKDYSKIEAYRGALPLEQLMDIVYGCHCFVFPAIGEGYALTPREMLATGMPTIISNGHSFTEFSDDYIKVEKYELRKGAFGYLPKRHQLSGLAKIYDTYSQFNLFYPDFEELKAKMREVYTRYSEYSEKAYKSALNAHKTEQTITYAQKLVDILAKEV